MARVFVPLTTACYNDFKSGKCWEIRRYGRQWNTGNIHTGREVTVSHGYSGKSPRRNGIVGRVLVGTLLDLIDQIPLHELEPRAESKAEAFRMNQEMLGNAEHCIAFEIKLTAQ
jgi:hypothetical protein